MLCVCCVDARLKTEKVWEFMLGMDSFVWKSELLSRVNWSDVTMCDAIHHFMEEMISHHWNKLSEHATRSSFALFVVRVLLHPQPSQQRQRLSMILQKCSTLLSAPTKENNLSFQLFTAFYTIVRSNTTTTFSIGVVINHTLSNSFDKVLTFLY